MSRISELVSEAVLTAARRRRVSEVPQRNVEHRQRTVALGVIAEDQVAKGNLDTHPLLVLERRPNVVRGGDRVLVGTKDDLGLLVVDVNRTKEEDETGEGGVRRDGLEPVVVEVGEHHLGLTRSKNLRGA